MAINSTSFLLFFVIVFALYYLPVFKKYGGRWQNVVLLLSSYFFYGHSDLVMLPVLVLITVVFYYLGIWIEKKEDTKYADWLLWTGVIIGVGMLLYFKYMNFFIQSFCDLFNAVGLHAEWHTMKIIMPLGISFFVFRLLSYVIEIHRGMMSASCDILSFATYVAFFPCILAGPIDRPNIFLPQVENRRVVIYDMSVDGLRQILWGMFKKMAIADRLAVFVNEHMLSDGSVTGSGSTLLVVAIFYTFQIYADFSGYSDMAIGVGKLLGIKVAKNFNFPFFSLNIADFWRKWHMSLTTWCTDYIYTPLCYQFRRQKKTGMMLAIIINFLIVGLWHGASWNYAIYGLYHGLLFVPLIGLGLMSTSGSIKTNRFGLPKFTDLLRMLLTFTLVVFGMLIFRSQSIEQFVNIVSGIGHNFLSMPELGDKLVLVLLVAMIVVEWLQKDKDHGLEINAIKSKILRWTLYIVICVAIFMMGGENAQFIYQVF